MSLKAYGDIFNIESLSQSKLLPSDLYDFIYSALVSGANEDGVYVDFTPRIVSQWLPEADDDEASKPLLEMLDQTKRRIERQLERAKNGPAPTTGAKAKKPKKATN